jgi:hypothetical protein
MEMAMAGQSLKGPYIDFNIIAVVPIQLRIIRNNNEEVANGSRVPSS